LEEDAVVLDRGCTDGADGTCSRHKNEWIKINEIIIQTNKNNNKSSFYSLNLL
jgi:hypothetical protein